MSHIIARRIQSGSKVARLECDVRLVTSAIAALRGIVTSLGNRSEAARAFSDVSDFLVAERIMDLVNRPATKMIDDFRTSWTASPGVDVMSCTVDLTNSPVRILEISPTLSKRTGDVIFVSKLEVKLL